MREMCKRMRGNTVKVTIEIHLEIHQEGDLGDNVGIASETESQMKGDRIQ